MLYDSIKTDDPTKLIRDTKSKKVMQICKKIMWGLVMLISSVVQQI